jgi:hypothetical protein
MTRPISIAEQCDLVIKHRNPSDYTEGLAVIHFASLPYCGQTRLWVTDRESDWSVAQGHRIRMALENLEKCVYLFQNPRAMHPAHLSRFQKSSSSS